MPDFNDLLVAHAALSLDKRWRLNQLLSSNAKARLDLEAGKLSFGEEHTFDIQLLGVESQRSRTWRWAWCDELGDMPAPLLTRAKQLRATGMKHGIKELTQAKHNLDEMDGERLAMVAAGLCRADAYFRVEQKGRALYLLLDAPDLRDTGDDSPEFVRRVFTEAVDLCRIDQVQSLGRYLKAKGYNLQRQGDTLVAQSAGGEMIQAEIDEIARSIRFVEPTAQMTDQPVDAHSEDEWESESLDLGGMPDDRSIMESLLSSDAPTAPAVNPTASGVAQAGAFEQPEQSTGGVPRWVVFTGCIVAALVLLAGIVTAVVWPALGKARAVAEAQQKQSEEKAGQAKAPVVTTPVNQELTWRPFTFGPDRASVQAPAAMDTDVRGSGLPSQAAHQESYVAELEDYGVFLCTVVVFSDEGGTRADAEAIFDELVQVYTKDVDVSSIQGTRHVNERPARMQLTWSDADTEWELRAHALDDRRVYITRTARLSSATDPAKAIRFHESFQLPERIVSALRVPAGPDLDPPTGNTATPTPPTRFQSSAPSTGATPSPPAGATPPSRPSITSRTSDLRRPTRLVPRPGETMNDDEADTVLGLLESQNQATLLSTLSEMSRRGPAKPRPDVAAALVKMIRSGDRFSESSAAVALRKWITPQVRDDVIALLSHQNARVRTALIDALANTPDDTAARALVKHLEPFPDRSHAIQALQQMGPVAEPAVLDALQNGERATRREACRVLERIATSASRRALEEAARDPDAVVASRAKQVLAKLPGG